MYFRIMLHAMVFAFLAAIAGAFLASVGRQGRDEAFLCTYLAGCTGAILGAIAGATRTLLLELPDAIERAHFVRKIRDIDDYSDERKER